MSRKGPLILMVLALVLTSVLWFFAYRYFYDWYVAGDVHSTPGSPFIQVTHEVKYDPRTGKYTDKGFLETKQGKYVLLLTLVWLGVNVPLIVSFIRKGSKQKRVISRALEIAGQGKIDTGYLAAEMGIPIPEVREQLLAAQARGKIPPEIEILSG